MLSTQIRIYCVLQDDNTVSVSADLSLFITTKLHVKKYNKAFETRQSGGHF